MKEGPTNWDYCWANVCNSCMHWRQFWPMRCLRWRPTWSGIVSASSFWPRLRCYDISDVASIEGSGNSEIDFLILRPPTEFQRKDIIERSGSKDYNKHSPVLGNRLLSILHTVHVYIALATCSPWLLFFSSIGLHEMICAMYIAFVHSIVAKSKC